MSMYIYRFRGSLILTLALALALSWAAPSPAALNRCASDLARASKVAIVKVEAVGEDLRVVMAWADDATLPGATQLRVRDAEGNLVIRRVVHPVPGEITERLLPGALEDVVDHGLGFTIKIGARLMRPYPFRAALSCDPPLPCSWELAGGVTSEAAVVDRDLAPVLDVLEAAGAPDVLAAALAMAPELTGEIISLAIDLGKLDERVSIPTGGACSCTWTSAQDRVPVGFTIIDDGFNEDLVLDLPAWQEGGHDGPGAAHTAGVQTISDTITRTVGGFSRLEVALRCWEFQGWTQVTYLLPGGPQVVSMPVFSACPASCEGMVKHETVFEARLEAQGVTLAMGESTDANDPGDPSGPADPSEPGDPTDPTECNHAACATAQETVIYTIDSQTPIIAATGDASVRVPIGTDRIEVDCLQQSALQWRPAPSEARLDTSGLAFAEAGADGFAFAKVHNLYSLGAAADAECALDQVVKIKVEDFIGRSLRSIDGGVNVEPWCRP